MITIILTQMWRSSTLLGMQQPFQNAARQRLLYLAKIVGCIEVVVVRVGVKVMVRAARVMVRAARAAKWRGKEECQMPLQLEGIHFGLIPVGALGVQFGLMPVSA